MVFSLVYCSTTDHDWTQAELTGLLTSSRDWNVAHDVTGLLLYRDCTFMQLLEGEEAVVRRLYASIAADRRHQDVDLLWTAESPVRRFADWSMAFRELEEQPVLVPGYRRRRGLNEVDDFLSAFRPG